MEETRQIRVKLESDRDEASKDKVREWWRRSDRLYDEQKTIGVSSGL